jgi:hypothetical protein
MFGIIICGIIPFIMPIGIMPFIMPFIGIICGMPFIGIEGMDIGFIIGIAAFMGGPLGGGGSLDLASGRQGRKGKCL